MSARTQTKGQIYEIRVRGQLDGHWSSWFGEMTIRCAANGEGVLSGVILDQAALYGVLKRIFDLGLPLLAVNQVEPATDQRGDSNHCQLQRRE
jgi:hypothetical protein